MSKSSELLNLLEAEAPPEITITLNLYDEDTEESGEVKIECSVDVEPTEYEGNHLFYQGGYNLDSYTFQPFKYKGKSYPANKKFPTELLQYVNFDPLLSKLDSKLKVALKKNDNKVLTQLLDSLINKLFDLAVSKYSVPIEKY